MGSGGWDDGVAPVLAESEKTTRQTPAPDRDAPQPRKNISVLFFFSFFFHNTILINTISSSISRMGDIIDTGLIPGRRLKYFQQG